MSKTPLKRVSASEAKKRIKAPPPVEPPKDDYQSRAAEYAKTHQIPIEKVFKKDQKVTSDLCKLKVANMLKKTLSGDYIEMEHAHFYHTKDSNGKPLDRSTPQGGHYHEIFTTENPDGSVSVSCGPPVTEVKNKEGQRYAKLVDPNDRHVHEIEYIETYNIAIRNPSIEAAKLDTIVRGKEAKIPGIKENM